MVRDWTSPNTLILSGRLIFLTGDSTIFLDLGLDAKKYAGVPTTWGAEETTA